MCTTLCAYSVDAPDELTLPIQHAPCECYVFLPMLVTENKQQFLKSHIEEEIIKRILYLHVVKYM